MMLDTEVLDILKIMCEVMGNQHKSRMFNSQKNAGSNRPVYKVNKIQKFKAVGVLVNDTNSNSPDYFRSSTNTAADERESQVLMNKIHY